MGPEGHGLLDLGCRVQAKGFQGFIQQRGSVGFSFQHVLGECIVNVIYYCGLVSGLGLGFRGKKGRGIRA